MIDLQAILELLRTLDTSSPEAILATFVAGYTVIMPLVLLGVHKLWESPSSKVLKLRSIGISLAVLVVGVLVMGASPQAVIAAIVAWVTSQSFYKDFLKTLGVESLKPEGYKVEQL